MNIPQATILYLILLIFAIVFGASSLVLYQLIKKLISEKAKLKRKEAEEARRIAEEEEKKKYLPCPFCGSKNVDYMWQFEFVICEDCRATGPITDFGLNRLRK